jgi:excisionase family DNA binding protein
MDEIYLTPEQVAETLQLGVETVYRWLRAGKLRGSRISQKAWRVEESDLRSFMRKQNVSEVLFEDYMAEQKLGVPDHEPILPGKNRRVDYRLRFNDQTLWFEVKEFAEDPSCFGEGRGGAYDPYIGIRKKIDEASKKFREYPGESCSLVLYNRNLNLVDISTPFIVLGAMLGNLSHRVPMDFERGAVNGRPREFFSEGGKLIDPRTKTPTNTRISAVIALEKLAVGKREIQIALAKKERGEDRRLSWEETFEWLRSEEEAYQRTALRALVYENPFAAKRLPNDIFTGPYDARWGPEPDKPYIRRLYAGAELEKLEAAERELELDLGPLEKMMKRRRENASA